MAACEVCGNEYDRPLEIKVSGETHTFDCFECAISVLAPHCEHCGVAVIGHGHESDGHVFCCAHCAHAEGHDSLRDRADSAAV